MSTYVLSQDLVPGKSCGELCACHCWKLQD